jgi:hypothetical protein
VFAERTGPGTPAFTARRMVINPGFERVELAMDPRAFSKPGSAARRMVRGSRRHWRN